MSYALPIVQVQLIETVVTQFKQFGSSLKPVDEKNGWFFQIIFELMDATVSNYHQRNLLELAVFTKYVLMSEANARRFAEDRLIDGCNIITSLRTLEFHINPNSDTKLLDDALVRMQAQMAAENVTATKYLAVGSLAEIVGMKEEYACMNRVCSKLVHPTAWSILAVNKGDNAFSQFRPIFFQAGAQYLSDLYLAIKEHSATHGMKPKP
jgi:hypothetical protein